MNDAEELRRGNRNLTPANEPPLLGLWHLALWIEDAKFDATCRFYIEGMGMRVVWRPDSDNVYLSSGSDNLALHRRSKSTEGQDQRPSTESEQSSLDHLGFLIPEAIDVQSWHDRLELRSEALQCTIVAPVRLHRDGATSCYVIDPAGNKVQIVHIPKITIPGCDPANPEGTKRSN